MAFTNFRAGNASAIVNAGTAVAAIIGPCNGGYIANPLTAASQGIGAAEVLYVDPTKAPGSTDAVASGTCSAIQPGDVWRLDVPIGQGQTIWVNAASASHAFNVVIF